MLANDEANGDSLNGDPHAVPGVHISYDDGVTLKTWLADQTGDNPVAAINGTGVPIDAAYGNQMAAFLRAGQRAISLVSPNVAAPGVDILAAEGSGDSVSGASSPARRWPAPTWPASVPCSATATPPARRGRRRSSSRP